jgi:hypothetical protein
MSFSLSDLVSWIGDTAGGAASAVGDAASSIGTGISDALGGVTDSFGADPHLSMLAPGEGATSFAGDVNPVVAGANPSSVYNPDFSNIAGGGNGGLPAISPSAPILAGGGDSYLDGGSMKSAAFNAAPSGGGWASGGGPSSGITGMLKNNASWLLPASGIGMAALKSQQPLPGTNALKANAAALTSAAGPLMDPLTKGSPLPGGAQAGLDAAAAGMVASIKSQHAANGTSGSSMEAQELAAVPRQIQQQQLAEAQTLYSQGLQTLGMADSATQQIMQNTLQQDTALTGALARVAASMAPTALKDILS